MYEKGMSDTFLLVYIFLCAIYFYINFPFHFSAHVTFLYHFYFILTHFFLFFSLCNKREKKPTIFQIINIFIFSFLLFVAFVILFVSVVQIHGV